MPPLYTPLEFLSPPTLNQIRQVISQQTKKLRGEFKSDLTAQGQTLHQEIKKVNRKLGKIHTDLKSWISDFDSSAPIESVFINPIK